MFQFHLYETLLQFKNKDLYKSVFRVEKYTAK